VARAQPGVTTIALAEEVGSEPARRRVGPPRHDRNEGDVSHSCGAAGPSPERAHTSWRLSALTSSDASWLLDAIKSLRYESILMVQPKRTVYPPHQPPSLPSIGTPMVMLLCGGMSLVQGPRCKEQNASQQNAPMQQSSAPIILAGSPHRRW